MQSRNETKVAKLLAIMRAVMRRLVSGIIRRRLVGEATEGKNCRKCIAAKVAKCKAEKKEGRKEEKILTVARLL